jgi:hypothetical protein
MASIICSLWPSSSSGLSSNDESKLLNHYFLIFIQFHRSVSAIPDLTQKVVIVHRLKKSQPFRKNGTQRKWGISFFGVARKRDLVFITLNIGEHHMGLAWTIRVIHFCEQIGRTSHRGCIAAGSGLDRNRCKCSSSISSTIDNWSYSRSF